MNAKIVIISAISLVIAGIIFFILIPSNTTIESESNYIRPTYNGIDPIVFNDLPDIPENFTIIKRYIYEGQIKDLSKVTDQMYKQPEFYPTWERNGIGWFTNHDYSRWGVHGYGFFPGEIGYNVINMSTNDEIIIHSFLHTSWGIETWQGLRLIPEYDTNYFNVDVTPTEVLLDPTFPKFYIGWAHRVVLTVTAIKPVPEGTYTISIKFGVPSSKTSDEWMWKTIDESLDKKYHDEIQKCIGTARTDRCAELIELRQSKYISSGGAFAPSKQYKVVISVT